ncbi:tyrosine-protein phosphatase non-receptor type substrate 1-like [Denticeps clupeoides]|uniref:tyrosine-protein phosphatase non-receptor type substrate 1-like n=1 Tax=Denticeps clupeoides TaxID=299321 RepID=UPI0010A35790|nr:tyrosine-protein phosphatase non-receptor type substrate 1-like [Denticeps clupeoides]
MATLITHKMQKILILIIVLKSVCSGHASTPREWNNLQDDNITRVEAGEEVILHCSVRHKVKTEWFGHRPGQTPFFKVSMKSEKEKPVFIWGNKLGINATWNPNNQSFSLNISNMTPSTEGFYYCTAGEGPSTVAGTVHSLLIKKEKNNFTSTVSPSTTNGSKMPDVLSSRCWVFTAGLCLASTAVTALGCWLCIKKKYSYGPENSQHNVQGDENQM